jgi:hypothetical protein
MKVTMLFIVSPCQLLILWKSQHLSGNLFSGLRLGFEHFWSPIHHIVLRIKTKSDRSRANRSKTLIRQKIESRVRACSSTHIVEDGDARHCKVECGVCRRGTSKRAADQLGECKNQPRASNKA